MLRVLEMFDQQTSDIREDIFKHIRSPALLKVFSVALSGEIINDSFCFRFASELGLKGKRPACKIRAVFFPTKVSRD